MHVRDVRIGRRRASAPDRAPHLLIVPDSPEGEAALARAPRARRSPRYKTFTLVEATGDDVADLTARRRVGARRHARGAGSAPARPIRPSPARRCSTRPARRSAPPARAAAASPSSSTSARSRTSGPPPCARRGVEVVTYMAQNGQLVSGDAARARAARRAAAEARFVRAITPYTAADKRAPGPRSGRAAPRSSSRPSPATRAPSARAPVAQGLDPARDNVTVANFTHQHVSLDAPALAGAGRARRRGRGRARRRARSCSTSARRRSSPARLNATLPAACSAPATAASSPTTASRPTARSVGRHHRRGHRQGRRPGARPARIPTSTGSASTTNPSRILYAQEATAARRRRARLRRPRHQRRLDRDRLQPPAPAPPYEDAQGFNYGLGDRALRAGSARPRSSTAPAASTSRRRSPPCTTPAYASGARISNNSWGAAVGGAYNTHARRSSTALVRDAQPGVAGNQAVHRGRLGRQLRRGRQHDRLPRARPRT